MHPDTDADNPLLGPKDEATPARRQRHECMAWGNTRPSLSKIAVGCLAIWGFVSLCVQAIQLSRHLYDIQSHNVAADCDCGSTIPEALSKGCVFDALASAWLPPGCRDDELTAQFNRSGPGVDGAWPYWADDNGTMPLTTADLAQLGGTNTLWYSTREWHLVHCNFYWRKLLRASQNGGPLVEARYNNMGHIIHCGELAKQATPLHKINVDANVPLSSAMHR